MRVLLKSNRNERWSFSFIVVDEDIIFISSRLVLRLCASVVEEICGGTSCRLARDQILTLILPSADPPLVLTSHLAVVCMLDLPFTSFEALCSVIHLHVGDCHTLQIIDRFVVLESAPTLVQLGSRSWLTQSTTPSSALRSVKLWELALLR